MNLENLKLELNKEVHEIALLFVKKIRKILEQDLDIIDSKDIKDPKHIIEAEKE